MAERETPFCPECDDAFDFPEPPPVNRRKFLVAAGATAAATALAGRVGAADTKPAAKPRPAEELIRELHSTLNDDQKKKVVVAYDHGKAKGRRPTRQGMYNAPIPIDGAKTGVRIVDVYTKPQIELLDRIVKAMTSGDEGYRRISRGGKWDNSGAFERTGALIFGDPTTNKYAFVLAGHHLTIRCDGNSEPGAAFGGPIYYGHSPNGYSSGNLFYYQTKSVIEAYKSLSEKQKEKAVVKRGNPGEHAPSVQFRDKDRPGIPYEDLSKDQRALVEKVMRDVLQPYRKEDVDEVMDIIKENGGMEKIQLAFYPDTQMDDKEPWHFWRLEGPGFVWNYRVLPHVHTYVSISSKLTGGA